MRQFIPGLMAIFLIASCGQRPASQANLKVDINVPVNQINSAKVAGLMAHLSEIQQSGTRGSIPLADLIAVIPFTETEIDQIHENRGTTALITCEDEFCVGTNSGNAMELDASQMNIPTIGKPHIAIAEDIELKFRIEKSNLLDICSILGFSVRKMVFWSELHAARVALNQNNELTQAIITASPTGYRRCE